MGLPFKLRLSPRLVNLAFSIFETPVEEMLFTRSRVIEYSYIFSQLLHRTPSRALDVGCTYRFNYLTPTLTALGWEVYGIDTREFRYKHPNFKFAAGDIRNTDFPDDFFDYICCVSVIEHIGVKDPSYRINKADATGDLKAMLEMRRILKPDGSLFLTTEFGKGETDGPLRVYNSDTIRRLFKNWTLRDISFYRNLGASNWSKVSETEASTVSGEPHAIILSALSPGK